MPDHSPLPWQHNGCDELKDNPFYNKQVAEAQAIHSGKTLVCASARIIDAHGQPVPSLDESDANMRLIVKAVNCHQTLLEALQNLMGLYDTPVERMRKGDDAFYLDVIKAGREALAKTEGGVA